jgi:hypothetical protein
MGQTLAIHCVRALFVVSALLALIAITVAPAAHADPSTPFTPRPNADNIFLMALTHFNIRVTADNIPKTIAVGHQVCTYIGQGHTPMDAVANVASANPNYTFNDAGAIVGSAIEAYCPQVPE